MQEQWLRLALCLAAIALAGVPAVHAGFYGPGTDVVELTSSSFRQEVLQSDEVVLVEFYAPWYALMDAQLIFVSAPESLFLSWIAGVATANV